MRISDWSSDVCSSDLVIPRRWCVPGAPTSTLLDAGDYGRGTLPVQDRWDRVRGVISHPRNTARPYESPGRRIHAPARRTEDRSFGISHSTGNGNSNVNGNGNGTRKGPQHKRRTREEATQVATARDTTIRTRIGLKQH